MEKYKEQAEEEEEEQQVVSMSKQSFDRLRTKQNDSLNSPRST